ncbi:hypothetical protein QR680_018609 [Steinernema hermaphroditum]|uniref:PABS domain-containing protein n=1 Tax=Steinernema hermaphroditum TaxID=289476 RepID=A0AA39HKL5_9BILA|nr:hypothetical protein QR680_018609 [Steinernema hermaphroditum]
MKTALFLAFLSLPYTISAHFIDDTVCSEMQAMCFDIGHGSSDEGTFRFVSPHNPGHGMETYLSRSSVMTGDKELGFMTRDERLAMKIDNQNPLYMLVEPLLEGVQRRLDGKEVLQILSIGLGAGSVDMYLKSLENRPNVTSVEIDPIMVKIAKNYFNVVEDDFYRIVVKDGIDVLKENSQENRQYDAVLVDACTGNIFDEVVCPAGAFLNKEAVDLLYGNLKKGGTLSIGVLLGQETGSGKTIVQFVKSLLIAFKNLCKTREIQGVQNLVLTCWKV